MHPADRFLNRLEDLGWKGRISPIVHIAELRDAIQDIHKRGLFDNQFYMEQLNGFSFQPPEILTDSQSIVVIAVPVPVHTAVFNWKGERHSLIIPPTYVHYSATTKQVEDVAQSILRRKGFHAAPTELPLKTLAVRNGLAEYGRNNICYVPGMGSYLQLVGIFTDIPCPDDPWGEPKLMDRCDSCRICMHSCPTGAITRERILIHAERCLTYHNEKSAEIPFPDWIDPSWHNCLIGCMACQKTCPVNVEVPTWNDVICKFSEDETSLLMDCLHIDQLPAGLVTKLQHLGFSEVDALPRNLSFLLGQDTVPVCEPT